MTDSRPDDPAGFVAARLARFDDIATICDLCRRAEGELSSERGGAMLLRLSSRHAPLEASLRNDVEDADTLVVCGTIDEVVVGFAVCRSRTDDRGRVVTVEEIYTDPDARRIGVGEAMLGAVTQWARAVGADTLDSVALPGMRDTKNFFETFGLTARALTVSRSLDD